MSSEGRAPEILSVVDEQWPKSAKVFIVWYSHKSPSGSAGVLIYLQTIGVVARNIFLARFNHCTDMKEDIIPAHCVSVSSLRWLIARNRTCQSPGMATAN